MSKQPNDPKGVRGPRGPQHTSSTASNGAKPRTAGPAGQRTRLEQLSLPLLTKLAGMPRWLVVVVMAVLLFLGLVQSGSLAWLGSIMLLIVAAFLGWLLALAWPVLPATSRLTRLVVVAAVVGIAVLKAMGRF